MASHRRMKLPSLKLTQRSTYGPVRHRTVPRGVTGLFTYDNSASDAKLAESDCHSDADHPLVPDDFGEKGSIDGYDQDSHGEPSLHFIKQKAAATAWEQNHLLMLKTCIECNSLPSCQKCIMCTYEAKYRCLQCAPWAFFCSNCFADAHRTINIFHVGEEWEVSCV